MTQVPEKVLSWLYSVLHEYHDPQRTYSDTARTLSAYPLLAPRTQIYTYEDGSDALLLTLKGTLPATFRGTFYHYPIKLHIPHAYPHQVPMVFVDPEKDMLVRPGQHVGVDGRVYHPYLRDWAGIWDRANIAELLQHLQQAFAKEPPVISRAQQQQYQRFRSPVQPPQQQQQHQVMGASQTPPHLPPKQRIIANTGPTEMSAVNTPPPLPPKPGDQHIESHKSVDSDGPPLPPLPHELAQNHARNGALDTLNGYRSVSIVQAQDSATITVDNQNGRPQSSLHVPALPYAQTRQIHPHWINHDRSPVSPISPMNKYSELPGAKTSGPSPTQQQHAHQHMQPPQHQQHLPQQVTHLQQLTSAQPHNFQHSRLHQPPIRQPPLQHAAPQKQPPPDLLSDPFDVALPGPTGPTVPAPPIPPNPEREHLLQAVSGALVQQVQQKVNQNLSAIGPLQAQQQALRAAQDRLESEIRQLEQLEQVLATNEAILHGSIQDCDQTIATAKSKKRPPIDEVLIAPTMVANQLWILCAEEAACREAIYVLQKAVDRGRISGNDFVRQMRALGRESFMTMALARKCAQGMGLEAVR